MNQQNNKAEQVQPEIVKDLELSDERAEETKAGGSQGFGHHGVDLLTDNHTINF